MIDSNDPSRANGKQNQRIIKQDGAKVKLNLNDVTRVKKRAEGGSRSSCGKRDWIKVGQVEQRMVDPAECAELMELEFDKD